MIPVWKWSEKKQKLIMHLIAPAEPIASCRTICGKRPYTIGINPDDEDTWFSDHDRAEDVILCWKGCFE